MMKYIVGMLLVFGLTGCYPMLYYDTPRHMYDSVYIGPWDMAYRVHVRSHVVKPRPPRVYHGHMRHR